MKQLPLPDVNVNRPLRLAHVGVSHPPSGLECALRQEMQRQTAIVRDLRRQLRAETTRLKNLIRQVGCNGTV
jgi:hypothetical protein